MTDDFPALAINQNLIMSERVKRLQEAWVVICGLRPTVRERVGIDPYDEMVVLANCLLAQVFQVLPITCAKRPVACHRQ